MTANDRLLSNAEEIMQDQILMYLDHMQQSYASVEIEIDVPERTKHTSVYGVHSGDTEKNFTTTVGIITGDAFFANDDRSSGTIQEGWLYLVHQAKIKAGQTVRIKHRDGKFRRYRVDGKECIGQTREVFTRYHLMALGD